MFTQCPECATAFRVTAEVLKQAAGQVRCGGCSIAFNALEYLSETKPDPVARVDAPGSLPELTPEPIGDDQDTQSPQTISPEQSAALLKTLDQLAGTNIRLEDTGIEWRVLDDDERDDDTDPVPDVFGDVNTAVDELLQETDTPVESEEVFVESEHRVEAGEIFVKSESVVEAREIFDDSDDAATDEELRFDDDTGLPEELADDEPPQIPAEREATPIPEPAGQLDESQVDLAFGDPDEWGELLNEVGPDEVSANASAAEAAESVETIVDAEPVSEPTMDTVMQPEDVIADTAASASLENLELRPSLAAELELAVLADDEIDFEDSPPDIDTQFGLQAAAMGIDLSGVHDLDEEEEADPPAEPETDGAEQIPDSTGALELELDKAQQAVEALEAASEDEETSIDDDLIAAAFENEQPDEPEDEFAEFAALDEPADVADEWSDSEEQQADDIADADLDKKEVSEDEEDEANSDLHTDEDTVSEEDGNDVQLPDEPKDDESWHFVPEPTEEEQTINRMIDQDLLRLAIEDDEGVASTMVLEGKKSAASPFDQTSLDAELPADFPEPGEDPSVETIIMEGEFVRTALEEEALATARSELEEAGFIAAAKNTMRGQLGNVSRISSNVRIIAGAVVLGLLLIGQFVHQSRAALATVDSISGPLGSLYNAVGAPITPNWDVTAWRFEVTKGSTSPSIDEAAAADSDALETTDEPDNPDTSEDPAAITDDGEQAPVTTVPQEEVLTIFSRIGNQSDKSLPYPLISVSLTDRFEEVIGSRVLEPQEYLAGDIDPADTVQPQSTFTAVIAIEAPSADATGFKLNVCYRQASGRLRCAIEDFK